MKRLIAGSLAAAIACAGFGSTAQSAEGDAVGAAPTIYVRLDTGWSTAGDAEVKDKDLTNIAICGDSTCDKKGSLSEVGSSSIVGGGVGYRFSSLLRGDATLSYRGGYKVNDVDKQRAKFSGNIKAWSLMLNGYVDVPMDFGIFKPYAGLGLGVSRVESGSLTRTGTAGTTVSEGGIKYSPAWAIMLGTGITVYENVTLDFGYRYFHIGQIDVAGGDGGGTGTGYSGAKGKLNAHELMAGIRYDF
jgi:opacity protein-like surface antigen